MTIDIDKSKEYEFLIAWENAIDDNNKLITSKNTGVTYRIDLKDKKDKLKYWNTTFENWIKANYLEPKEIFDSWYITKIN